MKAFVTIGIPCSGKSTWAEAYCKETGALEVNRDNIRMRLFELERYNDYSMTKEREKKVTECHRNNIRNAALAKRDVVISDTNLNTAHREQLIGELEKLGYSVQIKEFPVEFFDALKRNEKRKDKHIPRDVMYRMYRNWMDYQEAQGKWKKYQRNEALQDAYIVDIDGTIACNNGARGFYDWSKVGLDEPIQGTIDIVNMLFAQDKHIILLSGRDEVCKNETIDWCEKHNVNFDLIYMRPQGSMAKDRYVKEKLFRDYVEPYYNVLGVFDDRPQVSLLWHDLGLQLFKVGDPIREF